MNQQQMHKLLGVPERTLRDWKKGNREKLYRLLETLDYDSAQELLDMNNNMDIKRLLENEKYFTSYREFEKSLYPVLVSGRETRVWLELSRDTSLSKAARARSAYLYSFLTSRATELSFKTSANAGFYHAHKNDTGNGLAKLYGLKNGVDMRRFNQYKMTGRF